MKLIRFIKDYWYIPLIAIGGIFVVIWLRGRGKATKGIIDKVTTELAAISSQREARDVRLQLGHEQAKKHVQDKYAEKRKRLDAKAAQRASELEALFDDNPEQLAKELEKLLR